MSLLRALALILLLVPASPAKTGGRVPLPSDARITGLRVIRDDAAEDKAVCMRFHLSARQIRERFRTYRLLGPRDAHDHYAWFPCRVDGIILYRGKSFFVHANMANTMWTDWPDGDSKELGGVHDGDLDDGQ